LFEKADEALGKKAEGRRGNPGIAPAMFHFLDVAMKFLIERS
jgi:hypothetical protein